MVEMCSLHETKVIYIQLGKENIFKGVNFDRFATINQTYCTTVVIQSTECFFYCSQILPGVILIVRNPWFVSTYL